MVGDDPVEDSKLVAARELAAGIAGIVVAGFAASVLFPSTSPAGRVLIMSVVCGVLVALFTDWRARAGVTVGAVVVFVGFGAPDSGAMTTDGAPWSYTPSFALAVLLGCGLRRIAHSTSSSYRESWEDSADEPQ